MPNYLNILAIYSHFPLKRSFMRVILHILTLLLVATSEIIAAPLSIVTYHPDGEMRNNTYAHGRSTFGFSEKDCETIMQEDPGITGCIPNFTIYASDLPDDPFLEICEGAECSCPSFVEGTTEIISGSEEDCQWGHQGEIVSGIDALRAWETTTGSDDIIVAVIDSGVDYTHPDIAANMWVNPGEIAGNGIDDDNNGYVDDLHGINTLSNSPLTHGDPMDQNGHGTHVAGIIGAVADNGIGVSGVAQNVKIMAVRILGANGGGTIADAIEGIQYVINMSENFGQNILIMNNSWGGQINPTEVFGANGLSDTFLSASNLHILAASAAGNEGNDNDLPFLTQYPAGLTTANNISVASTNVLGQISSFSNYGNNTIHLAAPGESIRSLYLSGSNFSKNRGLKDGTVVASGTSMATPQVAGIMVLLRAAFPDLSPFELKDRLLNRVVPLRDLPDRESLITGGRASAYYALNDEEIPVPTPTATPDPTPTPTPTPIPSPKPSPDLTSPSPTPEEEDPIASPSPELQKLSYLLSVRGKKSKARRPRIEKFVSGKIFPQKHFEIQLSTVGLTFQSESLHLIFSINGEQCPTVAIPVTTALDGNLIVQGRLKRLMKSAKLFHVKAVDDENALRGESTAKIRHSTASKRRPFKIANACRRISIF